MATAIEPEPDPAWQGAFAPDLAAFEAIAARSFAALPEEFRVLCDGIEIRVAEMADDGEMLSGQMPNRVWLYRRAILDYWCAHEEPLGGVISHVLIHEIGHHFGLSDADMYSLESEVP